METPKRRLGGSGGSSPKLRVSPVHAEEDSPISFKRRRMSSESDDDHAPASPTASPIPHDAPAPWFSPIDCQPASISIKEKPEAKRASPEVDRIASVSPTSRRQLSFDMMPVTSSTPSVASSGLTTPTDSPYATLDFRRKYRKDELWAAIQSDYQYLMGDDIIETCKTTEDELTAESDDATATPTKTPISFNEFLQQYKELTDWLNQVVGVTSKESQTLSEKYLNQSYHQEMLERSPRRRLFQDYARQLQRRYPSMRDEIQARLLRVNSLWQQLEARLQPATGVVDQAAMIRDLEQDLDCLKTWLHDIETRLTSQSLQRDWTPDVIKRKMQEHNVLQTEIEARSRTVSAILQLCEQLSSRSDVSDAFDPRSDSESVQLVALGLERRWHAIWLQSLEWQCRLEEAHTRDKGIYKVRLLDNFFDSESDSESRATRRESFPIATQTDADFADDRFAGATLAPTHDDAGADTDVSNYDVIPFSEGEYEKIPLDVTTDDDVARVNADEKLGFDTDPGLDSAIGRSGSDHSVESRSESAPEATQEGDVRGSVERGEAEDVVGAMRRGATRRSGKRAPRERDVGYSSESHSNEDVRRASKVTSSAKPSWRHSITSAYDTGSNGSESNLHDADVTVQDSGFMTQLGSPSDVDASVVTSATRSSRNFYCMTTIDGGAESEEQTSSVDPRSTQSVEPNVADDDCTTFPELDLDDDFGSFPVVDLPLDDEQLYTDYAIGARRQASSGEGDGERRDARSADDLLAGAAHALKHFVESRDHVPRRDVSSVSPQIDAGTNSSRVATDFSDFDDVINQDFLAEPSPVRAASAFHATSTYLGLLKQAHLLAQDEALPPLRHRGEALDESFASTDVSAPRRHRSSSCDASDESGSEAQPEVDEITTKMAAGIAAYGPVTYRRKHGDETEEEEVRPKSFAGATDSEADWGDAVGFSVSEGAIDIESRALVLERIKEKLRRSASEQPDSKVKRLGDTPRKLRCRQQRALRTDVTAVVTSSPKRSKPGSPRSRKQRARVSRSPEVELAIQNCVIETCDQDAVETVKCESTKASPVQINDPLDHAWDNFQMPPQSCLSDDPEETKLDASHLQQEWDVQSGHDDDVSSCYGVTSLATQPQHVALPYDSDSDLEDFQHVIGESLKALAFTEGALTKHRRDAMETGIVLDPSEYHESLATCKTNIRCLHEVVATLESDAELSRVAADDVAHVVDVVAKWRRTEQLALERLAQSQQLASFYRDMLRVQSSLDATDSLLDRNDFTEPAALETIVYAIQERSDALNSERRRLDVVCQSAQAFENNNDDVNMNKFLRELDNLNTYLDDVTVRAAGRLAQLDGVLTSWRELREKCNELQHCLDQEEVRVATAEQWLATPAHLRTAAMPTCQNMDDVSAIVNRTSTELKSLSPQLELLRALHDDVAASLERNCELRTRAQVGSLDSQLRDLKLHCDAVKVKLEQRKLADEHAAIERGRVPTLHRQQPRSEGLSRVLSTSRVAFKILAACLFVLYIFYPEIFHRLLPDMHLQLRYVNGPPPT